MALPPELIDAAMAAFRDRLIDAAAAMSSARNPTMFCAAERALHALALELAAEMTREVLQGVSDDPSRRKEALAFVRKKARTRGIQMLAQRARKTQIRTLGGQVIEVVTPYAVAKPRAQGKLERRGPQGTGVYPVLDKLGISGRSTPALRLLVSQLVCEANSVSSARELLAASGVALGHKTALRLTYGVCEDALRARQQQMSRLESSQEGDDFAGRRVVATVDGGRIRIRRRVAGRPKKGGRKRFETEWREPKVLTLYVLDAQGKRDRTVPSVIDGTLGDADAVFALLEYHLRRLGGARAEHLVLVADAAPWIWRRSEALREAMGLPMECYTEVVDYFHAVQRLGDFAKARPRWSDDFRRDWVATQKQRLKDGLIEELEDVFAVIETLEKEDLSTERAYWARHRKRMRFAAFRAHGLPNGSGAVESAVRRVINLRMKGASILWTERHAEGILHLRAHAKSGRWNELERNVLRTTGWRPTARRPKRAT